MKDHQWQHDRADTGGREQDTGKGDTGGKAFLGTCELDRNPILPRKAEIATGQRRCREHRDKQDQAQRDDEGQFLDDQDRTIGVLFKLYPWEDLLRDPFANNINGANCLFLEPAWKALLSNKGLLPVLWQMFEGHPNLLPAFFEADIGGAMGGTGPIAGDVSAAFSRAEAALTAGHVRKPILSREGASVSILKNGEIVEQAQNTEYSEHPRIVQAYAPLPQFDGFRPVIGAWVVGEACVGVGIREDRSRITQDLSRFKPHFITA